MKTATITLLLVVAASLTAYVWQGKQPESAPELRVMSQKDTQIDIDTLGDTLAYFSSALGEASMTDIEKNVANYARQQTDGESQLDEELYSRFQAYKKALMTIDPGYQMTSLSLDDLWRVHDELMALQAQFFSVEEQENLFGAENQARIQSLEKMALKQQFDDEEAFHRAWESELSNHAPEQAVAYRRETLLARLEMSDTQDSQDVHLNRVELVGEEAAERLRILDENMASFDKAIEDYLQRRTDILKDHSLTETEKEEQIIAMRNQYFDKSDHRRVAALENINDD